MDSETIVERVRETAEEKKGFDLTTLDVRELSGVTDFFVLISGTSPPHLKALHQEIALRLKREGQPVHRVSGTPESGWVVLDWLGVVVHLFTPEVRAYYALETLWSDAPRRSRARA
jgi:ribosome-associated protein